VMDNDLVSADIVGGFVLDLTTAPFMHEPRRPVTLRLPIYAPGDEDAFPSPDEHDLEEAASIAAKDAAVAEAMAALPKRRGLIGRLRRKKEAKAVLAQVHGGAPSPRSDGGSAAATDAHSDAGSSVAGAERVKRVPGTVTGSVTLEATFLPFAHADAPPVESAPEEATGTDGRALTKAKSKLLARKVSTVRKNVSVVLLFLADSWTSKLIVSKLLFVLFFGLDAPACALYNLRNLPVKTNSARASKTNIS
jgi:hypothetical protein